MMYVPHAQMKHMLHWSITKDEINVPLILSVFRDKGALQNALKTLYIFPTKPFLDLRP